jgi:hypothetical protein
LIRWRCSRGSVSAVTAVLARTGIEPLQAEFAEEFDGPAGKPVTQHWRHRTGATGWGNGELQDYTNSPDNSSFTGDGRLALIARSTGGGYTSARLRSDFEARYGRIEAVVRATVHGPDGSVRASTHKSVNVQRCPHR